MVFNPKIILAVLAVANATALPNINDNPSAPVLPYEFNATLLKIGSDPSAAPIQWTKLYTRYDPALKGGGFSRFDFYNHYMNLDNAWDVQCSILFRDGQAFTIYPDTLEKEGECWLSHPSLPVLNPHFMQLGDGAVSEGLLNFRGVHAEKWRLGDIGDPDTIYYYARADGTKFPLRTTNQANDPGATDWFDLEVGEQKESIFELPKGCDMHPKREQYRGCPPDDDLRFVMQ